MRRIFRKSSPASHGVYAYPVNFYSTRIFSASDTLVNYYDFPVLYPKIAHEVMSYQAIFILGCGCDVKNLGPAMLVYPKIAHEVMPFRAVFMVGCGCDVKKS